MEHLSTYPSPSGYILLERVYLCPTGSDILPFPLFEPFLYRILSCFAIPDRLKSLCTAISLRAKSISLQAITPGEGTRTWVSREIQVTQNQSLNVGSDGSC